MVFYRYSKFFAATLGLLFSGACGSETPPARTANDEPPVSDERGPERPLDVSAEVGALDQDAVTAVFNKSQGDFKRCLDDGLKRVKFLGGSVGFFIKVDTSGALEHAHLERSTLGDRATEKCMLDVLRNKKWPPAVGGQVGLAHTSFEFSDLSDVRPPEEWEADRVSEAVQSVSDDVQRCKEGGGGDYTATLYVQTDGSVLAVGVTPPDEAGEARVDCLVDALKKAKYPEPGSWPAKVTFNL